MENKQLYSHDAGPVHMEVAIVDGALVSTQKISGKGLIDMIAAEVKAKTNSDIPVEVANFLEKALGLV